MNKNELQGFDLLEVTDDGKVKNRKTGYIYRDYSAGKGKKRKGYRKIKVYNNNGKRVIFYAHRFAYLMRLGEIPKGFVVDHINHIRNDNRIDNLRILPVAINRKLKRKKD